MEKPRGLIAPGMTVSYQHESIETESVSLIYKFGYFRWNREVFICL